MIGTGLALLGGSLISGALGAHSANKAAGAAKDAASATTAENRREFDLVRGDTAPSRLLGNNAIATLSRLYGYGPAPGATPALPSPDGQYLPASGGNNSVWARAVGRAAGSRAPVTLDNSTGQPVATGMGTPDMSAFFESPDYQYRFGQTMKGTENSAVARGGLLSGETAIALQRNAGNLASGEFGAYIDRLMQQAGLGSNGTAASAAAGANAASNISNANMNAGAMRGNAYMQGGAAVNNAVQGGISNYLLSQYLGEGGGPMGTTGVARPMGSGGYGYGTTWMPNARNG